MTLGASTRDAALSVLTVVALASAGGGCKSMKSGPPKSPPIDSNATPPGAGSGSGPRTRTVAPTRLPVDHAAPAVLAGGRLAYLSQSGDTLVVRDLARLDAEVARIPAAQPVALGQSGADSIVLVHGLAKEETCRLDAGAAKPECWPSIVGSQAWLGRVFPVAGDAGRFWVNQGAGLQQVQFRVLAGNLMAGTDVALRGSPYRNLLLLADGSFVWGEANLLRTVVPGQPIREVAAPFEPALLARAAAADEVWAAKGDRVARLALADAAVRAEIAVESSEIAPRRVLAIAGGASHVALLVEVTGGSVPGFLILVHDHAGKLVWSAALPPVDPGQEHHILMADQPGRVVVVLEQTLAVWDLGTGKQLLLIER